jgi:hypothetical protein
MNKHDRHRNKREERKERRGFRFLQSRAREKIPKLTIGRDEGVSKTLLVAASRAKRLYYNKRLPWFFKISYSLVVEHRYSGHEGCEAMTQRDWEDLAADFIRDFIAGALAEVAIKCGHYHCCKQGIAS